MTLSSDEIAAVKSLRAKSLAAKAAPTVATIPALSQDVMALMATRCFTGTLNASDLRYMALLQLQDEAC